MAAYARGDYPAAAAFFSRRARLGDPESTNNLGVMYLNGQGVARDFAKAMALFSEAAAKGLPGADYNIGMMHLRGYGTPSDPAASAGPLLASAERGDAEAQ
ncbi:MAG: tetratricopeptide repeat protein, partial [Gammaproteobacteria bacterium]